MMMQGKGSYCATDTCCSGALMKTKRRHGSQGSISDDHSENRIINSSGAIYYPTLLWIMHVTSSLSGPDTVMYCEPFKGRSLEHRFLYSQVSHSHTRTHLKEIHMSTNPHIDISAQVSNNTFILLVKNHKSACAKSLSRCLNSSLPLLCPSVQGVSSGYTHSFTPSLSHSFLSLSAYCTLSLSLSLSLMLTFPLRENKK